MRLWYLRRAVTWTALLGCLLAAVAVFAMVHRWPGIAWLALPLIVASCAAAAGFLHDEPATAVASVTPRGGPWRVSARLLAAVLPLGVGLALVSAMPAEVGVDRSSWWLVAAAGVLLASWSAAWSGRKQLPGPGGTIAGAAVVVAIAPVVLGAIFGWEPLFPTGAFPAWVSTFWTAAVLVGLAGCTGMLLASRRLTVRRR